MQVREEVLGSSKHDSVKKEKVKEEDPRAPYNETRRNSKDDGKDMTNGKGPKVSICQESRTSWYAYHSKRSHAKTNPHVTVGTDQDCSHHKSKNRCKWRYKCVFKHTGKASDNKNGNASIAMKMEEAEELNCLLEDGQGSTFPVRSIL